MLLWTSGSQCIYWEDFIKIHWLQFETTSNPLMCKFEITSSLPIRKKNYFNMNWKNIKSVSFFQNNFIWWKGQKSLFKSSFYKISLNLAYTFMRLDVVLVDLLTGAPIWQWVSSFLRHVVSKFSWFPSQCMLQGIPST